MHTKSLKFTFAFCSLLLLALQLPNARHVWASEEPVLSIPSNIFGQSGDLVHVPVDFTSGGHAIAGTIFSIDFDESCLSLNAADSDGDGVPDGVRFQIPASFLTSVSFDADDTDGELDIMIADFSLPLGSLPDQILLELDFIVICTPAPSETRLAPVGFSTLPSASFSDTNGGSISGSSEDGVVNVLGSQVDTPTPTATTIPTATAEATSTATATATATVTATPTGSATPTMASKTATPTPTAATTGTVTPIPTRFILYMPLVIR